MVRFSVVIPTYNEEKYISETLQALKNQTFKDFEVIVKDGKSQDHTVTIAQKFANRVFSVSDHSAADARNQGACRAKGEILVFMDADTLLLPETLERFSKVMTNRKIVGASCRKIPQSNNPIDHMFYEFINLSTFVSRLTGLGGAHGNCMLIRRQVFERVGGFNPDIIVAEEQELVRRTLRFGRYLFLLDFYVIENPRRLQKWGRLRLYTAWFTGMLLSFRAGKKQKYEKIR
jgi:glycosyltransferase involved in cell wall biosynthesis